MKTPPKILLITRKDAWCDCAAAMVNAIFQDHAAVVQAERTDGLVTIEAAVETTQPDVILSFRCNTVLPERLFEGAKLALNFHPGPPEYPGSGCYNFALYDQAMHYGCVCHHMVGLVDTGSIVATRSFPILNHDSVQSLQMRTMASMLDLLRETLDCLAQGESLPRYPGHWQRKPYTRAEFERLRRITKSMSEAEIRRRVRAVTYPGYPGVEMEPD